MNRSSNRALILLALLLAGCRPPKAVAPAPAPETPPATAELPTPEPEPSPRPLTPAEKRWVDSTLEAMSLREKAAQMVMVRTFGRYQHPRSAAYQALLAEVRDLGVGGLVVFSSELETIPRLLNEMQTAAKVPLLISADLERGMSFRVELGTVPLPYAMAVGATRSDEAARFTGEVAAREGRAVGIHWALAPVADVNNNPANPIINIRSYGEDPELVARMASAFVRGARGGGLLTTAKHFPGHGDTAIDSHLALPVVSADRARLERVELVPFRRAVAAGVDSVMLGHIAVPALDPSGAPASLSPVLVDELLRQEMGFQGLIATDAMEMTGVRPAWTGEATVRAVQAGADVILLPADPRVAIRSLVRGVEEGQLSAARLDDSVRRLLAAKARLGLDRERLVDPDAVGRQVARPEDLARAEEIARASITVVRNAGGVLPLRAEKPLRLLHLVLSSDFSNRTIRGLPEKELEARRIEFESRSFGPEVSTQTADEIVAAASDYTHVIVSAFVRVTSSKGTADMSPSHARLVRRLDGTGVPVIVVSFGSPYLLVQFPEIPVYVCAFGSAASSQRAAVAALFGEFDIRGKLPVTLPELYPYGHGLEIDRHPMTLARARPEDAGFRPGAMDEVDYLLDRFLAQKAFPGGVVAVGRQGKLVHLRPFGRLSYDEDSPPVTAETIYDLASLTKVVATTTMAMILVDEGRLDLDKPVQDFLPGFQGPGKEAVTVRHLLTHSSGVDWWAPLYEELRGKAAYLERIQAMDLVYEPGTRAKYSDLGLILLGEILERVAGQPLDAFVRERVFEPLGMTDTLFRPGPDRRDRIAPTEQDPWRGRMVRGEVHDENAFALGGVAPHAGLFGTAPDLARFVRMILNGGVLEHRRIVSRATVEAFTRRAGIPDSTRALGWDTKSPEGSSAGALFSDRSFGHTGFTGTSIWIDPERQLFVILLTNRVHPTRENQLIRQVRPAVADAVVRGLAEPQPDPSGGAPVQVGVERIAAGALDALRGKRLGLVVHAASVTAEGRHAIDVFRERGLNVVRLFSPEHGLRGRAAAGERVENGRDPVSGLPVLSLYGGRRKPDPGELEDLDVLVFDLQGAGVRFYTYVSTLILCLEAAGEAGIELVVLDRPNPLGGERVEGPLSAPRDLVAESFVNLAPGPLVHGLTMGEMARFVNARQVTPARLTIVPMVGWERHMVWADTGRPWVPPSPNLRSAEAALVYPGIALIEATNLSEGRGTPSPFLLLGAPWLDPARVRASVPGFDLEITHFTPRASPAAPHPKYLDQECLGLRVWVTDAAAAQPYRLGLTLLDRLAREPGFEWQRGGDALTWLLGTPRVYEALGQGKSVEEILAADRADHEAWRVARREALLY